MDPQLFDGAPPVLLEDPERVDNYRTALAVNGITPFSQGGEPPPPRVRAKHGSTKKASVGRDQWDLRILRKAAGRRRLPLAVQR